MGQKPIEGSNPSLSASRIENCRWAGFEPDARRARSERRMSEGRRVVLQRGETPARSGDPAERRDEARERRAIPPSPAGIGLCLFAPVAQLDRAPGYEPGGREFESLRAHHTWLGPEITAIAGYLARRGPGQCRDHGCLRFSRPAHRPYRQYPDFRLPQQSDYDARDIKYSVEHGESACLGVAWALDWITCPSCGL